MTIEIETATDPRCCPDGDCAPNGLSRRRFLGLGAALAGMGVLADRAAIAHALGVAEDEVFVVPADKRIPSEWWRTLDVRGEPTTHTGADLGYIGMPVGGICAGQLYLGGDGRLWRWDVFNLTRPATSDAAYIRPFLPESPFRSGFALRVGNQARTLDAEGYEDVRFTGQYPVGRVEYRSPDSPVEVTLEAFSPFVPLSEDDSSLPATIMAYTLRNTSNRAVDAEVIGWAENPVCLRSRTRQPTRLHSAAFGAPRVAGLEFSASLGDGHPGEPRPEIVFEDWERETYEGWTVEGDAFGPGPVLESSVPDYMTRFGDLNVTGTRFVTSHAFWAGDIGQADALTGRLLSRPFTIERRYVRTRVGGGSWERTALRVLVDGEVVASASGTDVEPTTLSMLDVARWEGREARIEILDGESGGWGHVNVDDIVFTDQAPEPTPHSELPDAGTFALAALERDALVRPSIAAWATLEEVITSGPGPETVDASLADQAGAVSVPVRIPARGSVTVRFALGWFFPVPDRQFLGFLRGASELRHHYATRFTSAQDVLRRVARERRLEEKTRLWVKTFYDDSTLPHWFLERTLLNASTLATTVCHRFHDGRFYGWEGTSCCAGTCQHVWNYAQAVARLFPALERDTRERVDLGIAMDPATGQTGFRAEADMNWAADGQAGTILRFYREHLTSTDERFLLRNWPRLKRAVEFLIGRDAGLDGTLNGLQHNTLDANWYGEIAWISSMYVAALYAAAELAELAGDPAFAARCRPIADAGAQILETRLWNGENFIQRIDPAHANIVNHNEGCHIDQMFGQSLAWQIGGNLPRVQPAAKCRKALKRVYRFSFTPDAAGWRNINTAFGGGRWFALEDEHGVIMTTWPNGGADEAPGDPPSWSAIYFNECWSGQEYQLAAHMLAEGLVEEGLLVTRAVHERYHPRKRNPYNEIECSEHYARAMASYGAFTTMCGFEYDGPRGHIGFAPRMDEHDFAAAFTAAAGWGLYRQERYGNTQRSDVEVRHGELELSSIALAVQRVPRRVTVRAGRRWVDVRRTRVRDGRLEITLRGRVRVAEGETLEVRVTG
jgi:non-lysosomal glucosylceramidase